MRCPECGIGDAGDCCAAERRTKRALALLDAVERIDASDLRCLSISGLEARDVMPIAETDGADILLNAARAARVAGRVERVGLGRPHGERLRAASLHDLLLALAAVLERS